MLANHVEDDFALSVADDMAIRCAFDTGGVEFNDRNGNDVGVRAFVSRANTDGHCRKALVFGSPCDN